MEILDHSEINSESNVQLTETMKGYLIEAAKWTRFMSIVGFGLFGLMALGCLIFIGAATFFANEIANMQGGGQIQFVFLFIMLIVYGVLLLIPSLYMHNFSSKTLKSVPVLDVTGIEIALKNLKSIFKFYGICIIVGISIYGILILVLVTTKTF
ncbi:hypothetical protein [Cytophaga aurantiaca]|uniref:hypothetical protein n=1 Tax=Cytophaga aurantiaca TaxID=29530 RepID=UPI00036B04A6|nr:hypothetical protein [Cytophaga aurantiaca]